jgi:hypothetical protein
VHSCYEWKRTFKPENEWKRVHKSILFPSYIHGMKIAISKLNPMAYYFHGNDFEGNSIVALNL